MKTTPMTTPGARVGGRPIRRIFLLLPLILLGALSADAANYYVDPSSGSMSNNGSSGSPWSTLADVFSAGKTFSAGDVIFLRSGNHGHPQITANNAGDVTIKAQSGHTPVINRIYFNAAEHWVLENVAIYTSSAPPESPVLVHPVYPKINNSLVRITNGSLNITLRDCDIYSIDDSSSWTANDWNYKAWNGVYIHDNCQDITVEGCSVRNTNFAIHTVGSASDVIFRDNLVENFCGDGMRANADNQVIEYNIIRGAYGTNGNHADMIQGFGSQNITIRGNIIIDRTESGNSLQTDAQAIGCFDGFFDDWVLENNLVVNGHWHGLTLLGARNCRVVNNTVVKNPYSSSSATPWIQIGPHKNGTASSGNYCRNNLTSNISTMSGTTVSNNIETTNYTAHFVDYNGLDFHLKSTSSAVDAGTTSQAPATDLDQNARSSPYDVGAYEYGSQPPSGGGGEIVAVTASSHDGNVPANTLDGNLGTRWSANGQGEWISYELSGTLPVSGVGIAFYNGNTRTSNFDIETSTNGSNWTLVDSDQSSGTTTAIQQFNFSTTNANYVRYVGYGNSTNDWNSLTEVEIYVDDTTQAPAVTQHPQSDTVEYGDDAQFSVTATGVPAPTFQWRKGGSAISGATSSTLVVNDVTYADEGSYDVVVTNSEGSDTSNAATLTVEDTTAPSVPQGLTVTSTSSTSVSLSWSAASDAVGVTGYKVYTDGANPKDVPGTSTTVSGLSASTQYTFTVSAYDAASNESSQSTGVQETTDAQGGGQTDVYLEPFNNESDPLDNLPPADLRSIYDWTAHTSNATLASGMQVVVANAAGAPSVDGPGYVVYAHGGGVPLPGILWTDAVSFDPSAYSGLKFSFYAANSNAAHDMRVAIRIGSQWYASDTAFSTASGTFSTGGELKELSFDPSGSEWRQLTFNGGFASSGTTLSLAGSTLGSSLPSGNINAVGVYLSTTSSGGNLRIDTFAITAGGESQTPQIVGVTASSDDGNVPANTLDGNFGTRWSALGSGEWIQYELNDVFTVSGIDIAFYKGDQRLTYFDIQVSVNGASWTTVLNDEESSGTTTNYEQFQFTPTSAKYVRYVGDGNSVNLWNSLTEVDLWVSQ